MNTDRQAPELPTYTALKSLLEHSHPRLICTPASNLGTKERQHTVFIDHQVSPPLDAATLRQLRAQLGDLPHLLSFYEQYGSVRLFQDLKHTAHIGRASAYYIAPPEAWPELHSFVEDWFSQLSEEEAKEFQPDWVSDYLAVGEIPNSGNYFLIPLVGKRRGWVFEFEHDGFEFIERGANFEEFVESLASVAHEHLERIGGHTRYTDGVTEAQWLAVAYEQGNAGA